MPAVPRKKTKSSKVVYRKLGREGAWGQAFLGEDTMEIDPRLGARRQLEVLCHEQVHLLFPDMSETQVDRAGKALSRMLWAQDYRRVLLSPNAKPPVIT